MHLFYSCLVQGILGTEEQIPQTMRSMMSGNMLDLTEEAFCSQVSIINHILIKKT